jgi:hypothetical protein
VKLSVKWQKFYKWYCIVSCLLVAVVMLLSDIGGTGWGIRNEGFYNAALVLSRILGFATIFGVDLLLWIISLVVWIRHRNSVRWWSILIWSNVMPIVKFWNIVWLAMLNGA